MLTAKKVSLILTYLVALGCFLGLYGIASDLYYFPLLGLFLIGLLNEWKFRIYMPRWMFNVGGVLVSILFLLELRFDNAVKPFTNMLLLLLAIKSLEEKKPRDIYQMLLLSLFGVAVSTTFRLDLSFLLFFLYELFIGSVAFTFTNAYANLGERPLTSDFLSRYLKFSVLFPLSVALATVPFFLILPRTQTPLFDAFARQEKGLVSGISDEVELGKVGDIQQDNTVVFRVYGDVPEEAYWRVSVFDTLLNTKWVRTLKEKEQNPSVLEPGEVYRYTIILEPTYDTFLPVLDYPVRLLRLEGTKASALRYKGGYYESTKAINRPVRYRAVSGDLSPSDELNEAYRGVPPDIPERVRELARELSRGRESPEEKLEAVKDFFKRGFSYSLSIEKPQGHPIEHFLFRSRRGNCEFFASSTALLLRLMGVPARVVGGFKGYIKNDYGDYYIVTNSMAHVWVEAYVGGRWLRQDTTPPYLSPAVSRISKLHLLRDALVSFWYENVVDFSAKKQVSLLRSAVKGLKAVSLSYIKEVFLTFIAVLFGAMAAFLAFRFYLFSIRKTPENLYRLLLDRLSRKEGYPFNEYLPEEVLKKLSGRPYYREVAFIVSLYQRHRFSPYRVTKRELEEAYRVLRKI